MRIPAASETLVARRIGSDAYVTLTVPARNIDGSMPADVTRIELYGYTGAAPPPRGRFLDGATLVATIPVAPPLEPGSSNATEGAHQGMSVTVRDALTAEELVAKPLPAPVSGRPEGRSVPQTPPEGGTPPPTSGTPVATATGVGTLRRFYVAIGFGDRGRPGPQSAVAELPLSVLPDPPSRVDARYTADMLSLSWEPSVGLLGFLLDRALPLEPPPFNEADPPRPVATDAGLASLPPGPTRYNIYRDIAPDPLVLPSARNASEPWSRPLPTPVNAAPLDTLAYTEPLELDERERCYTVRAVRGAAPNAVEGDPSARVCVTPVDVFAPAPPTGLSSILAEGAISLTWEPNVETDLAGYRVLRSEAGGDTLNVLTGDTPITEARFTDDTVKPGVRYVYEVVAVDSRLPVPNVSEPARVDETAR